MNDSIDKQKKIGNYVLGKTIGEGTFGKVKLATHTLTGQKVAIKILVKEKIIDVADVQRVSREIHILKLIRHPSIIQLYEIIETSKHLFLVMEYVEQGELFDYIVKKGKLEEQEACRFFKYIISGIHYIHELSIVHRDLKPQNLLIDWKNGVKIVDFGLSNTYKPGETLKTACGSPCYAAPEMISSKKYTGLQVDIWSCGVILFAMVCGYLPFEDSNTSQLYKKILSGQYVLPSSVSNEFKDLLQRILNVDPHKRYNIQQIFSHDWCKQVEDIPLKSGIIIGYHRIPVDRQILAELKQFDFDLEYAERCIEANKHNHITTAYHLLLKRNLRFGKASSADISSPHFDYSSIEPFKRVHNDKKYMFFGSNQETPLINIQNKDVKLHLKTNNDEQYQTVKHLNSHEKAKIVHNSHIRTNSFYEKEKEKNKTQLFNGKKFTELKIYLNNKPNKKQFYSQAKNRQERRKHVQSLHIDPKENNKDEVPQRIRMHTEYSEDKSHNQSKGTAKSKFQKLRNPQRLTTKTTQRRD